MNILNSQLRCGYCSALSRWRRKTSGGNFEPICARCRKDMYIDDGSCASCCEPLGDGVDIEVVNGLYVCGCCFRGEKCAPVKDGADLSLREQATKTFLTARKLMADPLEMRRENAVAIKKAKITDRSRQAEREAEKVRSEAVKTERLAQKTLRESVVAVPKKRAEPWVCAGPCHRTMSPEAIASYKDERGRFCRVCRYHERKPEVQNPFSQKGVKLNESWSCSRCPRTYPPEKKPAMANKDGKLCRNCYAIDLRLRRKLANQVTVTVAE